MSRARSSDYTAANDALSDIIDVMVDFAAEMRGKYGSKWQSAAAPSEMRTWRAMIRRREKLEEKAFEAWRKRR